MEIRSVLRGQNTGFAPAARPVQSRGSTGGRASTDRLELSREWIQSMEEQRVQTQAALLTGGKQEDKDEGGILGYMETEEEKLDGLSEALDVQMKCLKIAMNIMKGKKVPPEDERYLMENDPEGYKLAIAMKLLVKEDKKKCKSVLDEEDKNGGKTDESSDSGEPAPTEAPSGGDGGEAASAESGTE